MGARKGAKPQTRIRPIILLGPDAGVVKYMGNNGMEGYYAKKCLFF